MTAHEDRAEDLLAGLLETPAGRETFAIYQTGIQRGLYDPELLDVFGQQHTPASRWPAAQIAAFARLYGDLMSGATARATVYGLSVPAADRERKQNGTALAHLPRPFVAHVDALQSNADQDGWLEWTEPITVEKSTGEAFLEPGGATFPVQTFITVQPGSVPLEIGTTKASVTLAHLTYQQGVARWPYGHDCVHLLLATRWHKHRRALTPVIPRRLVGVAR